MEEESVYDLIEQSQAATARPAKYRSKFNACAPPTYSTFGFQGTSKILGNVAGEAEEKAELTHPKRKEFGTFGKSVGPLINPKQFLKKQTGNLMPEKHDDGFHRSDMKKPSVPSRDEKPVMGLTTDKNFVVANAVENILAVPKKQTGAEVRAVEKTNYGKVPRYITKIKSELDASYTEVENCAKNEQAKKGRMIGERELFELSAEEIAEVREGLQARWEQLNKQFSTMSFNLETRSQLRRKELLEKELKGLEQAIQRVTKPRIFVYDE